jgi:hypothetical protein
MDLGRRVVGQALVWVLRVGEMEIAVQPVCDRRHRLMVVQIQVLVRDSPPEVLNIDVVETRPRPSILICTLAAGGSVVKLCAVN